MHLKKKTHKTVKQDNTIECTVLTPRSCSMHTEESHYKQLRLSQRKADKYNFLKEIKKQATGIANKYNSKPQ